jgi:hypothetical protein
MKDFDVIVTAHERAGSDSFIFRMRSDEYDARMMLIVSFNDEFAPYAGKNGGQNLVNLAVHRLSDALPTGLAWRL